MEITIGRQGNQKTPITDQSVSRRHCKVTPNGDGTYTVENLSQLGTKVDGRDIIRATATLNSNIQLGPTFTATLVELIGAPSVTPTAPKASSAPQPGRPASAPQPPKPEPKTFSISHLQPIWEDFNRTNLEMAIKQRQVNLTRAGFGVFTMCAMPMIFFFGPVGYVLTGLGVLGNIYSFVGTKNAESPEQRQKRQEEFDDAWVCPNPECGHGLHAKNYKVLVRDYQSCPYCKCKYVEK